MAVNQTGAIFKSLIFDGENSRDYGVYITGEAVYNAPQRDVEMVKIAGRSGELALDKGRFENIEVAYPAGIFAETEADFREAVSDFRNLLCSKIGYVRLTDEYHPDEYRMAVYKSGLEVEPTQLRAGQFNITFDCKPQRWLVDGETPITLGEWGEVETVSGDIVEIDNLGIEAVKSLSVSLEPIQSGSGTPSPDNVRPISGRTECDVYVSPTTSETDAEVYTTALGRTVYGGTLDVVSGELVVDRVSVDLTQGMSGGTIGGAYVYFKQLTDAPKAVPDSQMANVISEAYEPIRFYGIGTTGTIAIRGSNNYIYVNTGGQSTPPTGKAVYELATPQTYQLTGQDVTLIEGTNYIWSDSGDITVEHGQNPNFLINPTRFESSPLLMVEGYGDIGFNGYDITLTDYDIGEYDMKVTKQVNIDNGTNYVSVMDGTFPAEIAETGNTIIATSMGISFASALAGNTANNITLGDITLTCTDDSVTYWGRSEKWKRLANRYHALAEIHVAEATFQLGTVHSFEVSGEVAYSVGSTDRRIHVSITFASDENGHIHVEALAYDHKPSSQSADRRKLKARGVSAPEIQIISTATVLGHPTYVDCDLGEAYRIVEDEYIPLNRYIDLGSDLPKLGVGENEVTVDDTITELQIVPRWWRV